MANRLGVPPGSLTLGSLLAATLLLAGTAALQETRTTLSPAECASLLPLAEPATTEEPAIEPMALHRTCDAEGISTVIVHGQFTSLVPLDHSFSIQLPGRAGSYAAITDSRGYFEMRIPRENFADDLCSLATWHSFRDEQMTLRYFLDFE